MAEKKFRFTAEKSPAAQSLSEQMLTRILSQPTWNAEQAAQILAAPGKSGLTIAQFAKVRGLSAGRLYNWKSKLRSHRLAEPSPASPETESVAVADEPDYGLNLQDPGERFMHDYLLRATQGPEPMWRLLSFRRHGSVLRCVVCWIQGGGKAESYSRVQLELTEPALRWQDFATAEAALDAMEPSGSSEPAPQPQAPHLPLLVPVQVRSSEAPPQAPPCGQPTKKSAVCMTLCLPSGVRIKVNDAIPKPMLRTVLRAALAAPC